MAPPKVFLTGATGYIGGDVSYTVTQAHSDWEVSVLVRNKEKGVKLACEYPNVRVVQGDLDSSGIIEEETKNADITAPIVIMSHLLKLSLKVPPTIPPRSPYGCHTSGTGILTVEDFRTNTWGLERAKQHDDWDGIIIEAGKRAPDSVKVAILTAAVLKRKKGFLVGEGKNYWHQVHVQDLSDLYLRLGDAAATGGGKATWNDKGYYLAENGPFVWGDIQRAVARAAYEKKLIPSPDAEPISDAEVKELNEFGLYAWGSSSRGWSYRGKKLLGWSPSKPSLLELIPSIIDIEAKQEGRA
ncbi:hypothetical protein BDV12DRAFT_195305 [Aspergillus spectabilis]